MQMNYLEPTNSTNILFWSSSPFCLVGAAALTQFLQLRYFGMKIPNNFFMLFQLRYKILVVFDVYLPLCRDVSMHSNASIRLDNGLFNSFYRICPIKKMIIMMPSPIIVALAV